MVSSRSRQYNGRTHPSNAASDDYDLAVVVENANIDDNADAEDANADAKAAQAAAAQDNAPAPDAVGSLPAPNADGTVTISSLNTQHVANIDKATDSFRF